MITPKIEFPSLSPKDASGGQGLQNLSEFSGLFSEYLLKKRSGATSSNHQNLIDLLKISGGAGTQEVNARRFNTHGFNNDLLWSRDRRCAVQANKPPSQKTGATVWKRRAANEEMEVEAEIDEKHNVNAVFIAGDASCIGVADEKHQIRIYKREEAGKFNIHQEFKLSGSETLSLTSINGIMEWEEKIPIDLKEKARLKLLRIKQEEITCMDFLDMKTKPAQMFAVGTKDGLIAIWEAQPSKEIYKRIPFIYNTENTIPASVSLTDDGNYVIATFKQHTVKIYRRHQNAFVVVDAIDCTSHTNALLLALDIKEYLNGNIPNIYNRYMFSGLELQENEYSRRLASMIGGDQDFTQLDEDLKEAMESIDYQHDSLDSILKVHIQYNFLILALHGTDPELLEQAFETFGLHTWLYTSCPDHINPIPAILN